MKSLSIRKNGNNVLARDVRSDVTDAHGSDTVNNPTAQTVTTVVRMNSGDYVELTAKHTDISHLAQFITPGESHFTMTWLGPGGG
jgi:hypothetical protein